MIELLGVLFELIFGILDVLSFVAWVADFIAWIRSKPSRVARKEAKREGRPVPRRSRSHVAFVVLTACSILLTVLLILKLTHAI